MKEPRRMYLESSVWSRLYDRADPERRRASRRFLEWARPRHFVLVSQLVRSELGRTRDGGVRRQILHRFEEERTCLITTQARVRAMAVEFVALGALSLNHLADAYHIAYAVEGRADALVTWDREHLAREHTRRVVEDYCWRNAMPAPRIGTPIEVGRWLDVRIG